MASVLDGSIIRPPAGTLLVNLIDDLVAGCAACGIQAIVVAANSPTTLVRREQVIGGAVKAGTCPTLIGALNDLFSLGLTTNTVAAANTQNAQAGKQRSRRHKRAGVAELEDAIGMPRMLHSG